MAALQIAGPDRSREAGLLIVRHWQGFFFRIKRRDVAHRPKNLFLDAACRLGESSIDRWLHIEAVVATVAEPWNFTTGNDCRPFFACQSEVGEHFLAMLRGNQRPQLGCFVLWPAQMQLFCLPF